MVSFVPSELEGRTGVVGCRETVPLTGKALLGAVATEVKLPSGNGGVVDSPLDEGIRVTLGPPLEKTDEAVAGMEKLPFEPGYGDSTTSVLVWVVVLIDNDVVTEIEVNTEGVEIVFKVGEKGPIPLPELVTGRGDVPVEPSALTLELDKGKGAELRVPETELRRGGYEL